MKYCEVIDDNLSKAGWSWGCVSALNAQGRTIWIADAHRGDGRGFVVHAEEKLSAFVELERQVLNVPVCSGFTTSPLQKSIKPSLGTATQKCVPNSAKLVLSKFASWILCFCHI